MGAVSNLTILRFTEQAPTPMLGMAQGMPLTVLMLYQKSPNCIVAWESANPSGDDKKNGVNGGGPSAPGESREQNTRRENRRCVGIRTGNVAHSTRRFSRSTSAVLAYASSLRAGRASSRGRHIVPLTTSAAASR
jgi:hypothetical protein